MTGRRWVRHRYPRPTEEAAVCQHCGGLFHYIKVTKARKYHRHCAHKVRLKQMRHCNEFIRGLNRAAREAANADH